MLSGGRLELGVSAGHMESEYDQAGLEFDVGATRGERLAESIGIVKRLLGALAPVVARLAGQ